MPQISTWYDMQLAMYVFIIPVAAMSLVLIFGAIGLGLKPLRVSRNTTARVVCIVCGCIVIAWIVFTYKTGERTESNRELIQRLERDYHQLRREYREEVYKVKRDMEELIGGSENE